MALSAGHPISPLMVYLLVSGAFIALNVFAFWRIFQKAGFPGYYAILMAIPVLNLAGLLYLAFSDWPVHRLIDWLEKRRLQ